MTEKFYSEREAAEKIGISRPTIRKYKNLGLLNPLRIRHTLIYSLDELERFKVWFISERK
jgi:DNA-binding transcriptional MerR regulator